MATKSTNVSIPMPAPEQDALATGAIPVPAIGDATVRWLCLVAIVGLGLVLRLVAAYRLTPHLDEASSILAAQAAAAHGWPIFPSGTVYFQGATLSWLLTPLVWLGYGDAGHLEVLRLPSVVIGTLVLLPCYRLGMAVCSDQRIALVMTGLVAIDPVSVQWSAHVRMYGLLQLLTVILALALVPAFGPARISWARIAAIPAIFWLAVYTHVGASLLLLAMAVGLLLVHRGGIRRRFDLLACLGVCLLAPLSLMILNRVLGTASVESAGSATSDKPWSFVGDNLLKPMALVRTVLAIDVAETLSRPWLVPGAIVAASTLVVLRRLDGFPDAQRRVVCGLLCLYWVPVLGVVLFTSSPKDRYLLHVHTIGYLFVAVLVVGARQGMPVWSSRIRPGTVVTLAIGFALLLRLANPVVHPDYHTAMAWVTAHQETGEPIVVARPAVGYLIVPEARRGDLVYLAGGEDQPESRRYTRVDDDGRLVDYWVGIPALTSSSELRAFLEDNPDAWIVLDGGHLTARMAYGGAIERVLLDMTTEVFRADGGALVLRVR